MFTVAGSWQSPDAQVTRFRVVACIRPPGFVCDRAERRRDRDEGAEHVTEAEHLRLAHGMT
jgi:hypothetical protein